MPTCRIFCTSRNVIGRFASAGWPCANAGVARTVTARARPASRHTPRAKAQIRRHEDLSCEHRTAGPSARYLRGEAAATRLRLPPADRASLRLARVVDRLAEHARRLLRRVEAHRVLGGHEVEPPLRLALQLQDVRQLLGGGARRLRRFDGVEHVDERRPARCRLWALRFWMIVARACSSPSAYGWQTWQARLTISSGLRTQWSDTFMRALAHVRHVAVGAGDAAARVDALAPQSRTRGAAP